MQWYVLWFACLVSGGFGASLAVAPSGVPVQAPIDDILSSLDSRRLLDHLRFLGDADLEGSIYCHFVAIVANVLSPSKVVRLVLVEKRSLRSTWLPRCLSWAWSREVTMDLSSSKFL